jgi:hypothetical protein
LAKQTARWCPVGGKRAYAREEDGNLYGSDTRLVAEQYVATSSFTKCIDFGNGNMSIQRTLPCVAFTAQPFKTDSLRAASMARTGIVTGCIAGVSRNHSNGSTLFWQRFCALLVFSILERQIR